MNFEVGDRVIVTHVVDERDEDYFQAGDYGTITNFETFNNKPVAGIKFKRCLDIDGNCTLGYASYWVEEEALMKCKKRMTWKQIRVLADIIAEGK